MDVTKPLRFKCITEGCTQYGFIKQVQRATVAPGLVVKTLDLLCTGCNRSPVELPDGE